jgi:hypothetical protein
MVLSSAIQFTLVLYSFQRKWTVKVNTFGNVIVNFRRRADELKQISAHGVRVLPLFLRVHLMQEKVYNAKWFLQRLIVHRNFKRRWRWKLN